MARIKKIKEAEAPVSPVDIIAAILTEALPVDDERRTFTVLNAAYFALSLTDPALAIAPLVRNSNAVIGVVAVQLRAAQANGDTPADLDPDLEAVSLLALSAGLGTSVLADQSSPEQAQAVIDYRLDRLFLASRPALRRAPMKAAATGRRAAIGTGVRGSYQKRGACPALERRLRSLLSGGSGGADPSRGFSAGPAEGEFAADLLAQHVAMPPGFILIAAALINHGADLATSAAVCGAAAEVSP